jgi:hypothetical protein
MAARAATAPRNKALATALALAARGGSRTPARSAAPAASAPRASAPAKSGFDDMDDDIPF